MSAPARDTPILGADEPAPATPVDTTATMLPQVPAGSASRRPMVPVETVVETIRSLADELPGGGEHRAGQLEMARSVHQSITDRFHLIAHAGTGTGKSLAYLVPVALSGRKTVVATATKALQDQLAEKDLPFLASHLPLEWAVLKGRNNYVCMQRLAELAADRQLALDGVDSTSIDVELDQLVEWAQDTITGDRAELPVEPTPAAWAAVSVGSEECPGAQRCPSGESCFAERARTATEHADLIVVNTHLYGIHLAAEAGVLPDHDVVIIDEAHQLEDIISATAGIELSPGRLLDLARRARGVIADEDLADRLERAGEDLRAALDDAGDGRLALTRDHPIDRALQAGRQGADRILSALRAIRSTLTPDLAARKERAQQGATTLITAIDATAGIDDDHVAYVSGPPGRSSLRIAPIDVGETLRDTLWKIPTVVLTSATIPAVLPEQLGLEADCYRSIDVGSPFDYEHAALLYCAVDLPEPRAEAFADASHEELERLIVAAGGRTLALFTSWRAMQAAVEVLRPRIPWPVLAQGELPKPALLEAFRADPESCLFATMSFWQGVDIRGDSLSLVVIDKIPFPRPDDPLLAARRDRAGAAAFRRVDLPRASMLLAQGTGRLIRSAEDRGVVAVLDRRLATAKSYRWDLVNALPPYRRTRDRAEAEAFLRRLRDA